MNWKRISCAIACVACVALAPLGCYEAHLIRMSVVHGPPTEADLTVRRDGQPIAVHESMKLEGGDIVATGPNTGAALRFVNGAELVLGPETEVEVLDPAVFAFFGDIWIWGVLTVNSDYGVGVTEGTVFHVSIDPESSERSRLTVLEGRVSLTPVGASDAVIVGELESVEMARPTQSPRRLTPAERDAMIEDANRFLLLRWERVPDVRGMPFSRAKRLLEQRSYHVRRDDVSTDDHPPGTVFEQRPVPGKILAQGQTVRVSVAREPPSCYAPDVLANRWTTLTEVERGFRAAGFERVQVFFDQGLTAPQDPKAGTELPCDVPVHVRLQQMCVVPSVRSLGSHLSPATVRELFQQSGFTNVGTVNIRPPEFPQSPAAGELWPCRTRIDPLVPRGGGVTPPPGGTPSTPIPRGYFVPSSPTHVPSGRPTPTPTPTPQPVP